MYSPNNKQLTGHSVCPWWVGYIIANPLRRLFQDPARILAPYVRAGMTVLEPGPGMGFFTLELGRRVGPTGRVVAVDIDPHMIKSLRRRAHKAGLLDRIDARVTQPTSLDLNGLRGLIDFAFAFAVVHEMPASAPFFIEIADALRPGASLLLAEPVGHVSDAEFADQLETAGRAGLSYIGDTPLRGSRAARLIKPDNCL